MKLYTPQKNEHGHHHFENFSCQFANQLQQVGQMSLGIMHCP